MEKRRGPYKGKLPAEFTPSRTTLWRQRKVKTSNPDNGSLNCTAHGAKSAFKDTETHSTTTTSVEACTSTCSMQTEDYQYGNLTDHAESLESEVEDNSEHCGESNHDSSCPEEQFIDDEDDISSCSDDDDDDDFNSATSGTGEHKDFNTPLYEGSRLTLSISILLIMTFAMRHSLSGEGLKDLLALIELHCVTPNFCRQSVRMLKKFFMTMKSPVQLHYYCSSCSTYIGCTKTSHCSTCLKTEISHFLAVPIACQLQSFFKDAGFPDLLQYPVTRTKEVEDSIEDVFDGKLYKSVFSGQHFQGTSPSQKSSEYHISLQLNTDGVSLFRSSKFSVWPIYMAVNELSPNLRYSRQYRIFAGLWFGNHKPVMNTFLTPLVKELNDLYVNGIDVVVKGTKFCLRAALLCVICDAPARCCVQNFTQFNGYYGCPTCEIKGVSVKTSERGSSVCFPFTDAPERLRHGHPVERTHNASLELAQMAENLGRPQTGIKGYSLLFDIPLFDIIRGVTVDYMHCVLLGVVNMSLHLWLDTKHKDREFYIRKSLGLFKCTFSSTSDKKGGRLGSIAFSLLLLL